MAACFHSQYYLCDHKVQRTSRESIRFTFPETSSRAWETKLYLCWSPAEEWSKPGTYRVVFPITPKEGKEVCRERKWGRRQGKPRRSEMSIEDCLCSELQSGEAWPAWVPWDDNFQHIWVIKCWGEIKIRTREKRCKKQFGLPLRTLGVTEGFKTKSDPWPGIIFTNTTLVKSWNRTDCIEEVFVVIYQSMVPGK